MFLYNESAGKPWWQPRHPGVVILDTIGVLTSLWWLVASHHWTTDIYLTTIIMLYGVSALYHHAQYSDSLAKLDHIMIFYVIAITALPYWGHITPFDQYWIGPSIVGAICVIGTIVKIVSFLPRFVSAAAYILAAVPMVSYFIFNFEEIPSPFGLLWLGGVCLYGAQLAVYTLKKPDPFSDQFGYREIQHVVLLSATNLHSFIVVSLV